MRPVFTGREAANAHYNCPGCHVHALFRPAGDGTQIQCRNCHGMFLAAEVKGLHLSAQAQKAVAANPPPPGVHKDAPPTTEAWCVNCRSARDFLKHDAQFFRCLSCGSLVASNKLSASPPAGDVKQNFDPNGPIAQALAQLAAASGADAGTAAQVPSAVAESEAIAVVDGLEGHLYRIGVYVLKQQAAETGKPFAKVGKKSMLKAVAAMIAEAFAVGRNGGGGA